MKIVTEFLARLNVEYNTKTIDRFLNHHPYHPSLNSISDLLDELSIGNAGVEIGIENFSQIPMPFIAKISSSDGDFCLVTELNNDQIFYLNEKNNWVKESLVQFLQQYSGMVLVAEKSELSGEENYLQNKKTYRQSYFRIGAAITLVVIAFISAFIYNGRNISAVSSILFLLKTLGLFISTLLLIQSFNANNPFINRLCSSSSGNGCNSILSSTSAQIFNGAVSWSEVGFFYFLSGLLMLSFTGGNESAISFLSLLNLFSLPYSFYSVWYQHKSKLWCRLCLLIQIILWLEFFTTVTLLSSIFQNIASYSNPLFVFILVIVISVALWLIIKPFIIANKQIPKLQRDINLFKKDENIFYTLLEQQREAIPIDDKYKMVLGNSNAAFKITFASNPFCMPCADMHKKLHKLLEDCRNEMLLNIVFTASSNTEDAKNGIIKILMATHQNKGGSAFEQALIDWFDKGINNPKQWMEKYKVQDEINMIDDTFNAHKSWCQENNITHTPTLFLNNYLQLSEYNFEDLKYFIHASARKQQHGQVQMV